MKPFPKIPYDACAAMALVDEAPDTMTRNAIVMGALLEREELWRERWRNKACLNMIGILVFIAVSLLVIMHLT